jgi:membrane protease YdiL (CAAX protease family)
MPSASERSTFIRSEVLVFAVLACLLSAGAAAPLIAGQRGLIDAAPASYWNYLPLAGPALAAVIVAAWTEGRAGVHDLIGRCAPRRAGAGWLLVAFVSPLALFALGVVIARLVDGAWVDLRRFGRTDELPGWGPVAVIPWMILAAAGEEVGWRGFALPRLLKRHGPLAATAILTAVVAVWHLPMFWYREGFLGMGVGEGIGFMLGLAAGAVVLTRLFLAAHGSALATTVWHGMLSAVMAAEISEGTVNAAISTVIMVAAVAILVGWRERRPLRRGAGGRVAARTEGTT